MKVSKASTGDRLIDSYPFSLGGTQEQANALKSNGIDGVIGYLGVINSERLHFVLNAGLSFMAVTLAGHFDGETAVSQLTALGLPLGCTVWLDLEGKDVFNTNPVLLRQNLNRWASKVQLNGYEAGLYVGVPQPLTSAELYSLMFTHYWRGQGSIRDRNNDLAEPNCGWTMYQAYPQHVREGVLVDVDMVTQDYRGRLPTWVIG